MAGYSQFEIVWDTPFSCDTGGRELLCPETDWNICIGKLISRSDVLMFRIPDVNQCVNNYFETEKS